MPVKAVVTVTTGAIITGVSVFDLNYLAAVVTRYRHGYAASSSGAPIVILVMTCSIFPIILESRNSTL